MKRCVSSAPSISLPSSIDGRVSEASLSGCGGFDGFFTDKIHYQESETIQIGQEDAALAVLGSARDFVEMRRQEHVRSLCGRRARPMIDEGGEKCAAARRISPFAEFVEDDEGR